MDYAPSQFTQFRPAYQLVAEHSNGQAEKALNLVHTTESLMRAKNVISQLPPGVGDDLEYDS